MPNVKKDLYLELMNLLEQRAKESNQKLYRNRQLIKKLADEQRELKKVTAVAWKMFYDMKVKQ